MKLYKLRSLADGSDYSRLKSILETGHFWCSSFNQLNDPMEGVFISNGNDTIGDIFRQKSLYKICSFSGKEGFNNPAMWCYYANSFKGVAIEIDIDENKISAITYDNLTKETGEVKDILTRKSESRRHENEYRFLEVSDKNLHKIGNITGVYFGNPYQNISNKEDVTANNENIREYERFKENFINNRPDQRIKKYHVCVQNGIIQYEEI